MRDYDKRAQQALYDYSVPYEDRVRAVSELRSDWLSREVCHVD